MVHCKLGLVDLITMHEVVDMHCSCSATSSRKLNSRSRRAGRGAHLRALSHQVKHSVYRWALNSSWARLTMQAALHAVASCSCKTPIVHQSYAQGVDRGPV